MKKKQITKAQAIKSIQKRIELLNNFKSEDDFIGWKIVSIDYLHRILPMKHPAHSTLKSIMHNGLNFISAISFSKSLFLGLIDEINDFGLPDFDLEILENSGVNVAVSNNNHQTQTTTVTISIETLLDVIKGELRASEIEEFKEILSAQTDPKVTKRKFIEKLKSFGENVSSNILANLVTNPSVWQKLSTML
ncbi:MAG: hypothetical protein JNL36_04675 [Candidatus Kapabacteria bacterium]|jgi:hypothetical protein|nr:hypothetical protein [Candidatus Kapabacteria bacterium]